MDAYIYFYFVTTLSIVYAITVRLIQNKFIDKNMMREIQEKSKEINRLSSEALKHNDKHKMKEVERMHAELMPRINAMMIGQMKMMVVVLAVFFAFIWVANQLDPTVVDDFTLNLTANSNTYSTTFELPLSTPPGFWYVTVKAYNADGTELAFNQTSFFVGNKTDQIMWYQAKGQPIAVSTDKEIYAPGERVRIIAKPPPEAASVIATLNNGTRFYVDLPFTIPLLNLRRIYDSQGWFIFSAVIIGLIMNSAISFMEKYLPKQHNGN